MLAPGAASHGAYAPGKNQRLPALVDRVLADDTVAKALLASKNRVIEHELAAPETRGEARGVQQSLAAAVLRVLGCDDTATLEGWLDRAATATSARDVFET